MFSFDRLAAADTVVLTTNLNRELGRTSDPAAIAAAVDWLAGHTDGWYEPASGLIVMKQQLSFYSGRRRLGVVGVGSRFLTTQRPGEFLVRDTQDGADLLAAAGLGADTLSE